MERTYYIVERVPAKMLRNANEEVWYCHMKGYDYIPVLGSIGTKKDAMKMCRLYNIDRKVRYK